MILVGGETKGFFLALKHKENHVAVIFLNVIYSLESNLRRLIDYLDSLFIVLLISCMGAEKKKQRFVCPYFLKIHESSPFSK